MSAADLPPVKTRSSFDGLPLKHDAESAPSSLELETPKMEQRYTFTSLVAFMICVGACWETIVATLYQTLLCGGPSVLVWGFVVAVLGAVAVGASLAELASAWTTAGGQYHWAAALATPRWRPVTGWFSSWIVIFAILTGNVAAAISVGQQVISYVWIMNPDYERKAWHVYLVFLGVVLVGLLLNIFAPRSAHHLSIVAMVTHFLGFFAVIITLLATTKNKNSAKTVFGSFDNYSGWSNNGISFFIGMLPSAFAFLGADVPAHFSEETVNAKVNVPRAMMWAIVGNAIVGFPFVIVIAFCMGDTLELLGSSIGSINPLAQIVLNSTGSKAASIVLCLPIAIVSTIASMDLLAAIARTLMAQARDGAVPFPHVFAKIDKRYNVPVNALIAVATTQIIIGVIYIVNSTAYYGITSGTVALQFIGYALPIIENILVAKWLKIVKIPYGPWVLGKASLPINIIAGLYSVFLVVVMLLPAQMPATRLNMNYASAITGGLLILAGTGYLAWGKKNYKGTLFDFTESTVIQGVHEDHDDVVETKLESK